jgi:hypothetical protein
MGLVQPTEAPVSGDKADEHAFQPKRWNSSPLYGIVTVWTT